LISTLFGVSSLAPTIPKFLKTWPHVEQLWQNEPTIKSGNTSKHEKFAIPRF